MPADVIADGVTVRQFELSHRRRNEPLDHRDFYRVVHNEARAHRIDEDCERLPPRQWHESRQPDKC